MSTYDELSKLESESPVSKGVTRTSKLNKKVTLNSTRARDKSRDKSRDRSNGNTRENSRDLPTRDEIQEFSFSLRDDLKVKVQAEVPHQWHIELEEIARRQNVKKLELFRFILGEFLGKVNRKGAS